MNFHDVRFPPGIARGARGGPQRLTEVVSLASGHEERNTPWADSRRRYDAGFGVRSLDDIHQVIEFFEARRGRLFGFRWKDHADFRSGPPLAPVNAGDQELGTGDGTTTQFQLVKTYGSGTAAWQRRITRPVAGTVVVAVDGIEQPGVTVDANAGMITLDTAPAAGAPVTAGFEFDVPARFDTDRLEISLAGFNAGDIPDIPVVEVRE
jgi:uncharacterized protein (TIGR02217 family)